MINNIEKTRRARNKVFYGWWVVAVGSLLQFLGTGSVFYGFNTFFNPMVNEFGWSRAVTSGAFSLSRLQGGIEGPIIGPLIDRFGARRIAIIGVILAGAGFIALRLVNGNVLSLYLIFGLLLSMGQNTFSTHATTTAAAKWFTKKRSLALSFIMAGGGIGGAVMVPLLAWLITQYGWRLAAVVAGLVILTLGLPAAIALRSTPEDKGLLPDGEVMAKANEAIPKTPLTESEDVSSREIDFTVREALKTSAFWSYNAAMMFRSCVLSAIVVHEIPYLVDMGINYEAAAGVLGMMVLISVPGRLLLGWLGDKFDKKRLMLIACLLQAIGIWIFINATSLGIVYLFVVVYGLGYGGAIPLQFGLRADLFGRRTFATMGGVTTALTSVPTVAASVLAGYLYDVSHSYRVAFYGLMVLVLLSGVAFLLIRQPKPPARLNAK